MKRQRSRNRNGGGGGGGGGNNGGGKPQHNTNRAFDSNGPEGVKVRGAAQHVYEKYQQLARDAQTAGDRVLAENYLQHAEHYFRLMRAMQPQRPLSEIIGRDQFVSGYDIDFEEDSGATESAEAESDGEAGDGGDSGAERQPRLENRFEGRREDYRQAESRVRDESSRGDRAQNDRAPAERSQERFSPERAFGDRAQQDRPRDDRVRDDRVRDDRARDDRPPRVAREDRPRFNRDDHRPARTERPADRDPLGVTEPEATPLPSPSAAPAEGPVLRAADGEISHAPAFLQVRPAEPRADGVEEPVRRPRRRRTPAVLSAPELPIPVPEPGES